jgi:hypothetical protein
VFSLIEHYGDDFVRSFIQANFTQCLPIMPTLPVHVMIEVFAMCL